MCLSRLNQDGSFDDSFHNEYWGGAPLLQPDGNILLVGSSVIRVDAFGNRDWNFISPSLPTSDETYLTDFALQPNAGYLLCGSEDIGLRRYYSPGSRDWNFNSEGVRGARLCVQPDNRILVARQGSLARLNAYGGWDNSFTTGGLPGDPLALAVEPDGRILVAVIHTESNGAIILPMSVGIYRFNANGTRDYTLSATLTGPYTTVSSMVVQPGGQVIVGGFFSSANEAPATNLVRLNGDYLVPSVTTQPVGQTRLVGESAAFSVSATGTAPLAYQWLFEGHPIEGATTSKLSLGNLSLTDAGNYCVIVSNRAGALTSDPASLTVLPVATEPGSLDITFDPTGGGQFPGFGGMPGFVFAAALQPDGKLLIGGSFTSVDGVPRNNIARLNRDWTVDRSFNSGVGADNRVNQIVVQPDGKVLISGFFNGVNALPRRRLARLNPDGGPDPSFRCAVGGADGLIEAIVLQEDGSLWIGGYFQNLNGLPRANLARLNTDGSVDTAFDPGDRWAGQQAPVRDVAMQPDGRVLVAGGYGAEGRPLVRLFPDGRVDESFGVNGTPLLEGSVETITLQPDGRIALAGSIAYSSYGLVSPKGIIRLQPNGALDTSFSCGAEPLPYSIEKTLLQSDGKLVIGGWFDTMAGAPRRGLARFNPDGALDEFYDPVSLLPGHGHTYMGVLLLDYGQNLILAAMPESGAGSDRLFCVRPDGMLDSRLSVSIDCSAAHARALAVQPDGKILVVGDFLLVNQRPRWGLARLLPNGAVDPSFDAGTNNWPAKTVFAIQPDGKIIVGGASRLLVNGNIDYTFNAPQDLADVDSVAFQTDGRMLIGGRFTQAGGRDYSGIARLNADGSLDGGFCRAPLVARSEWGGGVNVMLVQPDGKIIIVGGFGAADDTFHGLARLHADGRLDTGFNRGIRVSESHAAVLQPDGKIVVGDLYAWGPAPVPAEFRRQP